MLTGKTDQTAAYHAYLKDWDRLAWANGEEPDQLPKRTAADQGLHY